MDVDFTAQDRAAGGAGNRDVPHAGRGRIAGRDAAHLTGLTGAAPDII